MYLEFLTVGSIAASSFISAQELNEKIDDKRSFRTAFDIMVDNPSESESNERKLKITEQNGVQILIEAHPNFDWPQVIKIFNLDEKTNLAKINVAEIVFHNNKGATLKRIISSENLSGTDLFELCQRIVSEDYKIEYLNITDFAVTPGSFYISPRSMLLRMSDVVLKGKSYFERLGANPISKIEKNNPDIHEREKNICRVDTSSITSCYPYATRILHEINVGDLVNDLSKLPIEEANALAEKLLYWTETTGSLADNISIGQLANLLREKSKDENLYDGFESYQTNWDDFIDRIIHFESCFFSDLVRFAIDSQDFDKDLLYLLNLTFVFETVKLNQNLVNVQNISHSHRIKFEYLSYQLFQKWQNLFQEYDHINNGCKEHLVYELSRYNRIQKSRNRNNHHINKEDLKGYIQNIAIFREKEKSEEIILESDYLYMRSTRTSDPYYAKIGSDYRDHYDNQFRLLHNLMPIKGKERILDVFADAYCYCNEQKSFSFHNDSLTWNDRDLIKEFHKYLAKVNLDELAKSKRVGSLAAVWFISKLIVLHQRDFRIYYYQDSHNR